LSFFTNYLAYIHTFALLNKFISVIVQKLYSKLVGVKQIFIRVDGNNIIGYGHLFRCIALADMLKRTFDITFIEKDSNDFACLQLQKITTNIIHIKNCAIEEEANLITNTILNHSSIFILDGYQYTSEYQKTIKKSGAALVCIDDLHNVHFYADVIINQASGVTQNQYKNEPYTQFCLGFDWIIQRTSFIESSKQKRQFNQIESVFFTLGGGPIFNVAAKILSVLDEIPLVKRIVFLKGSQDVFEKDIKPFIISTSKQFEIYEGLNDKELSTLMKTCDIAICPASVVCLEACSVGIGIYAGYTADNQIDNYNGLVINNLVFELNDLIFSSKEEIKERITQKLSIQKILPQIENQKRIFDGNSKQRYIQLFKSL